MTKQKMLDVLMTLSALESWAYAQGKPIPDYLSDSIMLAVESLKKAILEGE